MSSAPTCNWPGLSGQEYQYSIHPMATTFKKEPGNYIFAKLTDGLWDPIYFGEAESLGDRCCGTHEKWDLAIRHGATHIHAHLNGGGRAARLAEETDLRGNFDTPCNDQ